MTQPHPPETTDPVRAQLLDALDFSYCQGLGYATPEELLAAYDTSRTPSAAQPARSDVGSEFVRQADQPDETGLAAWEADLRATRPAAARATAVRALDILEAALGDTLTPDARETALAGLAALLPSAPTRTDPAAPAAECSAQHRQFDDGRLCIRAAQHHGDHIDERGYHWSDTVAVYPVADGTFRTGANGRAALRRLADEAQPTEPETQDTCRSIEVAGQTISVRGSGVPAEDDLAFFGEVVLAAKRRYAAEHPDEAQPGTARHVHITIHHPDPTTANTAALSIADLVRGEYEGSHRLTITTDANEQQPAAGEQQDGARP